MFPIVDFRCFYQIMMPPLWAAHFLGSAGNSKNWCPTSYANLHAFRDSRPHFFDSVGQSENWWFRSYVNLRANRDPMAHFFDSVGRSANGPSLSLGKGATFVPKVSCFTVHFFAGSHRLRVPAPYMVESAIVLSHSANRGLTSSIVLANPKTDGSDLT